MNEQQKTCECEMHEAFAAEFSNSDRLQVESGHPIDIMCLENAAFNKLLDELQESLEFDDSDRVESGMKKLMAIHSHYGKKEELFMPILYQHGVTGPSQVMWTVDDEIKSDIRNINKKLSKENYPDLKPDILTVLVNVREMILREEQILLPVSFKFFTQDEWLSVYRDMPEFGYALIEDAPKWQEGENFIEKQSAALNDEILPDGHIKFDTGEISLKELQGILQLLPADITFIDTKGNTKFFINEGRIFSRPKSILNRSVLLCHPPKLIPVIEKLFEDFKSKKRRRMEVWKYVKGKPVAVKYIAVYDRDDNYIGTVELVEDFSEALDKFANKTGK